MRRVTRNAIALVLLLLVALLALGVLPGFLKTGDPYYVTAEPIDSGNGSVVTDASTTGTTPAGPGNASAAINGSALSEQRFPYTTRALRNGTSDPYWKGPWGLKGAFTHSPFDEVSALEGRNASAVTPEGVLVTYNGTLYSVAVGQRP